MNKLEKSDNSINLDSLFDLLKTNVNDSQDSKPEKKIYDSCSNCKKNNLVEINGELICKECGNINCGIIDANPEWRYYGNEDSKYSDPTRVGMPTNILLPQSSLGSTISFKYGESYDMRKIRRYHSWTAMPYKERSLYNVFDKIKIVANNNGIPTCIIEEAQNLYKRVSDVRIHRGSNRKGIIAACIYKACIIQESPRSAKEIAVIFEINISHMTKGCKKFDEIINMNVCDNNHFKTNIATKSKDFVQRFCSKLNIGNNIYKICNIVCEKAETYNLVSKCIPPSIAAGSIYLVCNLLNIEISKRDIAKICNISEVTISKCYKNLYKYHEYLFPEYIIDKLYPNRIK